MYLAKRIGDELLAPPKPKAEPEEAAGAETAEEVVDELDGAVFRDEQERPLGIARRLPGVAVYVVSNEYANANAELERYLAEEPEGQIFVQRAGQRIVGLIYVPEPSRAPTRPDAMRADEI
jgi:hypothetical protein